LTYTCRVKLVFVVRQSEPWQGVGGHDRDHFGLPVH
jgi:hypothetical protein